MRKKIERVKGRKLETSIRRTWMITWTDLTKGTGKEILEERILW